MAKPADPVEVYAKLKARIEENKFPIEPIYFELADRIFPGDREIMPRIMACLANAEQARIVAALPDADLPAGPGKTMEVSDAFAAKLGMDKAAIAGHIRELFEKGLVFPTRKGPNMARTFMQLHDAALGNPNYDESLGRIYYDLWGFIEGPMNKPAPKDLRSDHTSGGPP